MNITLLSGLIFVGVFAGVVLIHELGHFVVARLLKVEVEEFGFGLPPRVWRFWRTKGWMLINNQRIEIPRNFNLPFSNINYSDFSITATANKLNDQLVLASIEYEERVLPKGKRLQESQEHIWADQHGNIVEPPKPKSQVLKKVIGEPGSVTVSGKIGELHQGTEFTINWLPLGGFVRPRGENDPSVEGGLAASKPIVRLGVLVAGPFMNLLAGVLVSSILFAQVGIPDMTRVMLYEVTPDSPAARAGLQANDLILRVNNEDIADEEQFRSLIQDNIDQPLQITVLRGEETVKVTAMPLSSRSVEEGALGILPGPPMVPPSSFIQTIPYGTLYTVSQIQQIISLPVMLIRNQLSSEEGRFIGLKGIYDLFGQAVSRDVESRETTPPEITAETPPIEPPTNYTLLIIASLTITLGVFNLLPFPALDGGRILFVLPELIFRKRVPPEFENVVHGIGFALLIGLMIYINAMDFINPVNFTLP